MPLLTNTEIESALKQGHIPQPVRENDRLLPEDTPAAIAFEKNAHRIAARLLGPTYDPGKLRFMLSADDNPNAFIMNGIEPPLIVMTRGLINLAQSEDEIAAVMAHELGHKYLRDKLGIHDNSKGEEAFADSRAIVMLRDANYRQDAMRMLMERLPDHAMSIFATATDPHPQKDMRIRLCSNAEKAINLNALEGKGEQRIPFTTRPDDLMQVLGQAVFTDRHIENVLRAEGFDGADPVRQMQIMERIIPQELAMIAGQELSYYDFRIQDIAAAIGSIKADAKSPEHRQSIETLVDTLLSAPEKNLKRESNEIYNATRSLYVAAIKAWTGKVPQKKYGSYENLMPIGRLETMSDSMRSFIGAKSTTEAEKSAQSMNALFDHYFDKDLPIQSSLVRDLTWPAMEIPDDYTLERVQWQINDAPERNKAKVADKLAIKPSWDAHARWAEKTGSKEIAIAIHNFGIRDPRLPALSEDESKRVHQNIFYEVHEYDHAPDGRITGKKGSIFSASNPRPLTDEEKAIQRDVDEAAMLRDGNWKREMETDFHGFVEKYKAQLLPVLHHEREWNSEENRGTAFAQAFCDHLRVLLQAEPGKYKPLAEHFFSAPVGATPSGLKQLIDDHLEAKKQEHISKPDYLHSANHPYTKFVLENPSSALSLTARLSVMDRSCYFVPKHQLEMQAKNKYGENSIEATYPYRTISYEKCWRVDPQKSWPLTPLKNFADLNAVMKQIDEDKILGKGEYEDSRFFQDRLRYNVTQFLEKNKAPCTTDEMWHLVAINNKYRPEIRHSRLGELIEVQLERNVSHELESHPSPEQLVKNYLFYSSGGTELFKMKPQLKRNYEQRLIREIKAIDDPSERQVLTWQLLKDNHRLEQPEFREFVVQTYVDAAAKELGKDNDQNRMRIRRRIEDIFKDTSGDVRFGLLTRLADATETQRELTLEIQQKLQDCSIEQLVKSKMSAAMGEVMLDQCSRDETLRIASLEYLTTPLTERSLHTYKTALTTFAKKNEHAEKNKELLNSLANDPSQIESLRSFHENFWAFPFEGRQLGLEKILFPVHEKTGKEFDRNMRYAMDKVFPSSFNSNDRSGRDIVQAFLQVCDEAERRLLLSAMLVATEPGVDTHKGRNVGKTLNQLKALGPAGDKLLQAIHSHPSTPENIREEIGESKSNSQWVPRWKIFEWLKDFGPDTAPGNPKTVRVGKLLGVGAYGATVALEKENNQLTACTLLKPAADTLAETMFDRFKDAAEILLTKRTRMQPVREMIAQAGRMSKIETDMSVAESQAKVAAENYNGMKVSVNGQEFTFRTANWVGSGKRYKETEVIEGKHFNELPTDTEVNRSFKANAARAQLAAEVYLRLTGKAVDHDRHGAQQRIKGTHIGIFDHGGQAVAAPTESEKRLMARVIVSTMKANYGWFGYLGKPLGTALTQAIQQTGKTPEDREYLASMQRDVLALGDFVKTAVEFAKPGENVMKEVIGAVLRTGHADPVIMDEIKQNLGRYYDRVMKEMMSSGESITIAPAPRIVKDIPVARTAETGRSAVSVGKAEDRKTSWVQQVGAPSQIKSDHSGNPDKPGHTFHPGHTDAWSSKTSLRKLTDQPVTAPYKK